MRRHLYKSDEENWKAVYYRDSHDYDEYELRKHNNENKNETMARTIAYDHVMRGVQPTTNT